MCISYKNLQHITKKHHKVNIVNSSTADHKKPTGINVCYSLIELLYNCEPAELRFDFEHVELAFMHFSYRL